jgi:hypothetical protein
VRGAGDVRAAAAALFIVTGVLYIGTDAWLVVPHKQAIITAIMLIPIIVGFARLRSRVPRKAEPADYDYSGLAFLADGMGRPCPRVYTVPRNGAAVRVRGTSRRPAIVLSPLSLLTWRQDPGAHSVQVSHEMGHVWARDLGRFYFLSTGVLVVLLETALITFAARSSFTQLVLAAAALALLSLRSFLRAREHAADFLAAQVLGASARDTLPDTDLDESRLPRLLRSHPSPAQRRAAFAKLEILYTGLRLPMFSFGYTSALSLQVATAAYRAVVVGSSRTTALQIMVVFWTVLVGWVFGRLLASGAIFASAKVRKSWFRSFLFGALACLLAMTPSGLTLAVALVYAILILIVARIMVPVTDGVFFLVADTEHMDGPAHTVTQAVLPALAWTGLIESYYFHVMWSLAGFVGRIL